MPLRQLHPWDLTVREARAVQTRLSGDVSKVSSLPKHPRLVAGLDVSGANDEGLVTAAAVVVSLPDLEVVEVQRFEGRAGFPYVPGLLSFREAPLVLGALGRLQKTPDVVLVDGHGLAHPRRFGLACHVGLIADVPTVGCAKSVLVGNHPPVGKGKGECSWIEDGGEVVGAALRTRDSIKPVYVSVGHRVDLPSAIRCVLDCCGRFRLPEPTRLAHRAAARLL